MIITPYDLPRDISDIEEIRKIYNKIIESCDTKFIYAKDPVISDYPKDAGIDYIITEIMSLETITTKAIVDILSKYIPFIEKHQLEIIKEFDEYSSLAYKGELPTLTIDKMDVKSYFGFSKFQVINAGTITRANKGVSLEVFDYSFALDSNVTSNFMKYDENKDERYKDIYDFLCSGQHNIDIFPYVYETIMNGFKNYGLNYKLNKNNKNEDQKRFFDNLKSLHRHGFFKERSTKKFINNIIKIHNIGLDYVAYLYYSSYILVFAMLEARIKFKRSQKNIVHYVYKELREYGIPIENRYKAILYLFAEKPGHTFFKKIINIHNTQTYFDNIDNTVRDIALSTLDKYVYSHSDTAERGIFPLLASNDSGFIDMLQDTKPDFIFKFDGAPYYIHVYTKIAKDLKKHSDIFISETPKILRYHDQSLKDLAFAVKNKEKSFREFISTQI